MGGMVSSRKRGELLGQAQMRGSKQGHQNPPADLAAAGLPAPPLRDSGLATLLQHDSQNPDVGQESDFPSRDPHIPGVLQVLDKPISCSTGLAAGRGWRSTYRFPKPALSPRTD